MKALAAWREMAGAFALIYGDVYEEINSRLFRN